MFYTQYALIMQMWYLISIYFLTKLLSGIYLPHKFHQNLPYELNELELNEKRPGQPKGVYYGKCFTDRQRHKSDRLTFFPILSDDLKLYFSLH